VRVANDDPLATAFNKTVLLPTAQSAAYGVQSRACHFGDILPADREVDLDSPFDLAAGLLGEPQQSVGDALLHLLGRHLNHTGVGIL
jgi:hypothetical protein